MTLTPKLSFIVLSYNYADLIGQTIRSILAQTMQDFEIVVVDDASTDGSCDVVRSFADLRILLLINERNVGGAASYNRAVEAAQGEWLVNLDADDWIAPEKAERQLAFAAADPGLDIIGTYLTLVDADGKRHPDADAIEGMYNKPHAVERLDTWFHCNPFARSSSMVRRAAHMRIGLDDPGMVRAPDYELWTRFLRHGCRFGMVPEKLTFLRLQSRGVTRGDPLGSLLELAYARLRNLLPLLEQKAQHPSFLQMVRWLVAEPNLSTLPPVQAHRLVGLLMAPPPDGDYLTFRAHLADPSRDPWLAPMGRRMLAYSSEMQEQVGRLQRDLGAIDAAKNHWHTQAKAACAEAEHWRQAGAARQTDVLNQQCQSSRSGTSRPILLSIDHLIRRFLRSRPRLNAIIRHPFHRKKRRLFRRNYSYPDRSPPLPNGDGAIAALHEEQPKPIELGPAELDPRPGAEPPVNPERRLAALWPTLQADMRGLMDVANALTPNDRLLTLLLQRCLPMPALHTASVVQRLMARLPSQVEHLVVVPWLGISGGSERVTQRLLKRLHEHYVSGGLCVLAPDAVFDLSESAQRSFGVPIVALNDLDRTLSDQARVELLDRVLVELRPATVHNINSDTAWQGFRDHGHHYARDCGLFANIYSDFRYPDGTPMGIFWRYLADCLPHMAGVIADNGKVIARAQQCFALLPEQMARFHVVPTPILGVTEEERCHPYHSGRSRHSLWMSRIAMEKRIDVLREISQRCPDRRFSIYGTLLPDSVPDDFLEWTKQLPNVRHCGRFVALSALPVEDYDSYIFTTSTEGMPISLLEATMLGLPTVAPDIGGIGEFIDADTGWLVQGSDDVDGYVAALAEIEVDPAEAGRRVAAAQARLQERHSWTSFCRSLAAIPGYLQPQSR